MSFDVERAQRRVAGMSEREMLDWLGAAIPGMQRHLEAYERTGDRDHLGELMIAETTANLVMTELIVRKFTPREVLSGALRPAPSVSPEPKTDTGTTSAPRRFIRPRRAKTGAVPVSKPGTEVH